MHPFRAKTLCRPSSQTQTFRYRSIKQNKKFCFRLSKQNKTTLSTMSSNFSETTDPSTGNVCFFRFGIWNHEFQALGIRRSSGNRQFLAMVTFVTRLGSMSFKVREPAVPCNGNLWLRGWQP